MGSTRLSPQDAAALSRNMQWLVHTEELRRRFEHAGVPLLLLKGAAYLDTLYVDLSSRPMVDVDVLVRAEDRLRAEHLARDSGFVRQPLSSHPASEAAYYHWLYMRDGARPLYLEIHTGFCPTGWFAIDYAKVFDRAVSYAGVRRQIPTLSSEDSLLFAALHEGRHSFASPARPWVEDCRRILEIWRPQLDEVVERARCWGMTTCLYVYLSIARHQGVRAERLDEALLRLRPAVARRRLCAALVDLPGSGQWRWPSAKRTAQLAFHPLLLDSPMRLGASLWRFAWLRAQDLVAEGRRR